MRAAIQTVFILVAVILIMAASEVKTTDDADIQQTPEPTCVIEPETSSTPTCVPSPSPSPVNNSVETTEEPSQIVDNPVNDVYDSEEAIDMREPPYTEEELEILALIIYQEAGANACSDDTRRKVGSVFLNRVNSYRYPNTFKEVATQYKQYGELYWTGIRWPNRAQLPQEANAIKRAYTIAEELLIDGSCLPYNVLYQAEFTQGDGIYCQQDGFYFCYLEVNE